MYISLFIVALSNIYILGIRATFFFIDLVFKFSVRISISRQTFFDTYYKQQPSHIIMYDLLDSYRVVSLLRQIT